MDDHHDYGEWLCSAQGPNNKGFLVGNSRSFPCCSSLLVRKEKTTSGRTENNGENFIFVGKQKTDPTDIKVIYGIYLKNQFLKHPSQDKLI
jgi:hypothetical protein